MAIVKVLYTTTSAIKAAIGVDDADIEDTLITDQNMADQMASALVLFNPTHATDIFNQAKKPKLEMWCMWFGALRLAESPLSIAKKYGTGKDEWERYDVDWEALRKLAGEKLAELQDSITPTAATVFSMVGKATPDYNPIEGP